MLIISSLTVSGCSNSENSEYMKVMIGNDNISYVMINKLQQDSSKPYKDTFKFAFKDGAEKNIKYINIGDKVVLDFGNSLPDKVTVKDIVLSSSGEELYTDKEVVNVPLTKDNGKYNFAVEKNIISGLSSVMHKTVFRGFLIAVYKGKSENEYAFVIETDSIT